MSRMNGTYVPGCGWTDDGLVGLGMVHAETRRPGGGRLCEDEGITNDVWIGCFPRMAMRLAEDVSAELEFL